MKTNKVETTNTVWTLTDDDSAQYVKNADEYTGTVFELWQVCELPDGYGVAYAIVHIEDYTDDEIKNVLNLYGYRDMDDFVEQTAPGPIQRNKDGSLDKESPNFVIEWQLIAEMLFETKALTDALVPGRHWEDFDSAAAFIRQEIGVWA